MLLKKLLRTFARYKAQFISMIVMIVLGVGIFSGFNAEWYTINVNTSKFYNETNFADYRIYNEDGFTYQEYEKVNSINGVDACSRFTTLSTSESKENDTIDIVVSEKMNVSTFTLLEGEEYDESATNSIWLSKNYVKNNDYKLNDIINIRYGEIEINLTIKGIIMSSEFMIHIKDGALMPNYNTVGYGYVSPKTLKTAIVDSFINKMSSTLGEEVARTMGEETYEKAYYQMNIISSLNKKTLANQIDTVLGKTTRIVSKDDFVSYSEAKGEEEEGKTMGLYLPIIFLIIAMLTMITTMNRLTANEKGQIGILKALGFKNRRIVWHYTSYALFISVIGSILGIALGFGIGAYIASPTGSMGTYLQMPYWSIQMPWFVILGVIGIIAFMTLIGFLSVNKLLKGNAAEVLRPAAPKKMRKLLIEKSKLFTRMSFESRWNLRDSIIHPARSLMSIFGVFGCTLLMFASFGLSSTFNSYIDKNFHKAATYESKLVLSESASEEDKLDLIHYYNADYTSTTPIAINDETYMCDVLSLDNGNYHLLDDDSKLIDNMDKTGAYVCKRIANEFKLKINDQLTFSLYGTNTNYTVNVIGVVSYLSEAIVMDVEYANSIGFTYSINSCYTKTPKENIAVNPIITSISSKQEVVDTFNNVVEIMNTFIAILVAFSALLGFVVLYNLGVMSFTERYKELSTLRVLGFKDNNIKSILVSQNIYMSFIGIVLGIPAGAVAIYIMLTLLSEYEMTIVLPPYVFILTIFATLLVTLIVSLFVSLKTKKINMVESLKAE